MVSVFDYLPTSEIFKLENDISSLVKDRSVHFVHKWHMKDNNEVVSMKAYTFNDDTNCFFLLESLNTFTKSVDYDVKFRTQRFQESSVYLLTRLKDNLKQFKKGDIKSFTIIWSVKDDDHKKKTTSYFYASTLGYALRKLYAGRDEKIFMIHEAKLNPKA